MAIRPIDAYALALEAKRWFVIPDNRKTMKEAIDNAPTLDYEPVRHGEWVEEIEPNVVTASGRDVHLWRCSACGFSWANKHDVMSYYKHCPNCGAKMDGGKKDG